MSWNGAIPRKKKHSTGLRNKRSKKSPKALAAKMARQAKSFRGDREFGDSQSREMQWND